MTDNKQVEQIARAAQPLFDWIKQYYPKIDISDDKQLSLYTSYHNLSQVLDKLKEDQNVQGSDTTVSEQSGEAGSQIDHELEIDCLMSESNAWKKLYGGVKAELREAKQEIERLKKQQPTEVERMKWVKADLENKFKELYSQSHTAINQMNIGVGQMTTRDKLKAHENAVWEFIEWLDSTPNTQADEDVIREHLISFLMDIDECYAMHIRENAERCVDEYLAKNSQPTPKEDDVEKMAEDILQRFANEHSYQDWPELVFDSHDNIVMDYTKEVMIEMYNAALSGIDLDQVVYVVATDSDNKAVDYNSVLALSLGWEPSTKGMLKKTTIRQLTSK
jgi:hypothetical protein